MVTVKYNAFLGPVERSFPSMERAVQWARQCGQYRFGTTFTTGTSVFWVDGIGNLQEKI